MANALQLRRGTTTEHGSFTGLAGEITVDTTKDTIVVHDGSTQGGIPLATESSVSASNLLAAIKTVDGAGSGLDADLLDGQTGTYYTNYADTAVANLVSSAPSTLDTLNELAAALGDDPNFATTVTNSLAGKLSLTGGTMTGDLNLGDGDYLNLGNAADLVLLHDGFDNYITSNNGNLFLNNTSNDADIFLRTDNGTGGLATYVMCDGSAGTVSLHYYGNAKLTTKIDGVDITGTLTTDGLTVDGRLDIEEVFEKVNIDYAATSGTITFNTTIQGVMYFTAAQTANRIINFSNVNVNLGVGQSVTGTVLLTQGSTAYYLNTVNVDGTTVTPKWSGGSAPTAGNANGIDVYTFTIIKTANATFTVLASVTQFA